MEISNQYFRQILLEKLKEANKMLIDADRVLYNADDYRDEWQNVREANLIIDDLIDAMEKE